MYITKLKTKLKTVRKSLIITVTGVLLIAFILSLVLVKMGEILSESVGMQPSITDRIDTLIIVYVLIGWLKLAH